MAIHCENRKAGCRLAGEIYNKINYFNGFY